MLRLKLKLDCIACIVKQALKAARLATSDEKIQEKILRRVMEKLLKVEWCTTPPKLVQESGVLDVIRELSGVDDPYEKIKVKSNDEALALSSYVKEIIRRSRDPLETAVRIAIAGNIIDFAAVESYDLKETINRVLRVEPAVNYYSYLRNDVLSSEKLLYIADNAGEIVFDKILIEEMIGYRGRVFKEILFVVKDKPMVNDATIKDAEYIGIDRIPNLKLIGEPAGSERVRMLIKKYDLVISKGQGNYEEYSSEENIYFLLIAKCPIVAEDLGVKVGDVVILFK